MAYSASGNGFEQESEAKAGMVNQIHLKVKIELQNK
jgi:hypothetical protein